MINIVYIIPCLIKAGPVNVLYDIVSHIDRNIFNITIITLKPETAERNIRFKFEELGVNLISFRTSLFIREFAPFILAKKIEKTIAHLDNVIIHAHSYHSTLIASYLRKFKTVTTIHNISNEDYVALRGKYFGNYMSYRFNSSLKRFDINVAISEYMMLYYSPFSCNLIKILNGVDFNRINSEESSFLIAEKNKQKVKYIVVIGRLSQRKNVLYIIRELKSLKRNDFVCFFVGLGEEMENCKNLIDGDSRFRLTGYVNNVQDYLVAADIYLSASKSEGMPLSVLEALNVGVPSLLSNIPPHREIVNEMNLPSVVLFNSENGELRKKIDSFLEEDFSTDIISSRANKIFSSSIMSNQYEKVYLNLISK